ncbi:PREDICTED: 28S ribosomal protein S17, mitochondrial-like [Priapulus caudatus]|uniref:28S ribosomal protein S17, mitochondrial-like n=1 Tax=Priapulus caudatus TaxID=37621 RepID=A0ABM1E5A7_PRICU|nr:PREDICTED: 28S ribosomal protein S17, mitochondrial-like [Priapulus caudatus]
MAKRNLKEIFEKSKKVIPPAWTMEETFKDVHLVLGQVVEFPKENEAKVRVIKNAFDRNLHMYFKKRKDYHAALNLQDHTIKIGDVVLIRQLSERITLDVTHIVEKVVYPLGAVTDPITGKPVAAGRFKEHQEEISLISIGDKLSRAAMDGLSKEANRKINSDSSNTALDHSTTTKVS